MSSTTAPALISDYFAADASRNAEAIVALFAADAVVIDEQKTWRGASGIRAWRDGPASTYEYTTELFGVDELGDDDYLARVRIEGNFPGGSVELRFRFTIRSGQIHRLEIAP
jgi:hypothetical protein